MLDLRPKTLLLNEQNNLFVIDWLTVTFHTDTVTSIQVMLDLLKYPWETKNSFINGYPLDTSFSSIHIRWGADDPRFYSDGIDKKGVFRTAAEKARSDMGISLDLSGQGCRSFEEYSGITWIELIKRIFEHNGRITRLDLAYDDHTGVLDIYRIALDVKERNYISKSKFSMIIWSDDQEENIQGTTVQIGSKSSPVLIRIYDKAAERGYDHSKHWIRVELQLRKDRAHEALKRLFQRDSVGKVAAGILRNYLSFRIPSADTNKSRWEICPYWDSVLLDMEKISVWVAPGEPYNFTKSENHMVDQYGQFLQAYAQIHGGLSSLLARCEKAHKVLKPKYRAAVQTALQHRSDVRAENAAFMKSWGFDLPDPDEYFLYEQANFAELFDDDPDLPFLVKK